ncbi:GTPase HflX [Clostridia bacterium]|nr:GTPase HflX [Clostridia bacterium]
MIEVKEEREKVILFAVNLDDLSQTTASLEELEELSKTAGVQVCSHCIQNRENIHPTTYFGKGKIEELKELIALEEADAVICDDELSPAQIKHLTQELSIKVLDRTLLILDIFASRAFSYEGKVQVELAQLQYLSTRLKGMHSSLSRLGGGGGVGARRGPGEKKLELDRRVIQERMDHLREKLDEVVKHREVAKKQRKKNPIPLIALVGYTNAGKSTLLNALTGENTLAKDELFATLDSLTRSLTLENGQKVLLTDTVGFIRKLPHQIIQAFRSTLEEVRDADLLLHVVDSTHPDKEVQMAVVKETLKDLEADNKDCLLIYNKCDQLSNVEEYSASVLCISAKKKEGLDLLKQAVEKQLKEKQIYKEKLYSYQEVAQIQWVRQYAHILSEEYLDEGILIKAYLPNEEN